MKDQFDKEMEDNNEGNLELPTKGTGFKLDYNIVVTPDKVKVPSPNLLQCIFKKASYQAQNPSLIEPMLPKLFTSMC